MDATTVMGDRVVASVGPPCGSCAMCRAGHLDHCDTAFAEHVAVDERCVQRALVDEQLGLVEPTAVTFFVLPPLERDPRLPG